MALVDTAAAADSADSAAAALAEAEEATAWAAVAVEAMDWRQGAVGQCVKLQSTHRHQASRTLGAEEEVKAAAARGGRACR